MKILFLCGSLEPSKDGVGDYTRRLAGELIRKGNHVQILSLYDKQAVSFVSQTQMTELTSVLVGRIPETSSYIQRLEWTQDFLNKFQPDWISLQFVSYSFHAKGLPFWLLSFLKKLKGNHQWHIMFHELWIGIEKSSAFKYKLVGLFQKQLIQNIKKSIEPKAIHTQAKIYQYYLSKSRIKADYLPLFGNVCVTGTRSKDLKLVVFVVFATIHDKAPFKDFIIDLKNEMQKENKEIKFIFTGRNGDLLSKWIQILDKYSIQHELLGPSSEEKISNVLFNADYGISSTPYKISDKSGVVAAMREHQLPIINVAKPWVDQDDISVSFDYIINYSKRNLRLIRSFEIEDNNLSSVCDIFLKSIHN